MQSEQLKELEKLAAKGENLPENLRPPEIMLYYMLSGLYAQFQSGKLAKPEAASRKQAILRVYEHLKNEYEQYISICKEYQERLRNGYKINENALLKKEVST